MRLCTAYNEHDSKTHPALNLIFPKAFVYNKSQYYIISICQKQIVIKFYGHDKKNQTGIKKGDIVPNIENTLKL